MAGRGRTIEREAETLGNPGLEVDQPRPATSRVLASTPPSAPGA